MKPDLCENCHKRKKQLEYRTLQKWCKVCETKSLRNRWTEDKLESYIVRITDPLFRNARLEDLSEALQKEVAQLPDDKGLLLWGKQGVGKSYAMAAIMRKFILEGFDVQQISYEMLCLQIRDTYKSGSTKTELDVIKPLIKADKLFIEDVGATVFREEQEREFSRRTFLVVLDRRLRECKPIFITTNKSVEELGKSFDARIASRLQEICTIIQLSGKDRRAQTTNKNEG